MNEISSLGAYPLSVNSVKHNNVINFKADKSVQTPTDNSVQIDRFVNDYEKAKKQAKRDKNLQTGISVFIAATFAVMAGLALHQSGLFGKKVQQAIAKDVSKEKTFEELALSKEMQKEVEDIKTFVEKEDLLKELGEEQIPGVLFYGEPGGGKNAYIYALTKYIQEKFPGSKLFEANVLKFNDKYWGGSENNVLKYMENVVKEAKANPDKKIILFLDEIDSVARKASGSNAEISEKIQNAFKTAFNDVLETPNIIITAATNKASKEEAVTTLLDDAIMNRFAKKVFVPLPTGEQHIKNFIDNFKQLPEKYVSKELLDPNNETLKKLCDYISQDGHHVSFRDAISIFKKTKLEFAKSYKDGNQITIDNLKEAVLDKANQLNWPPSEIEAFKKTLA